MQARAQVVQTKAPEMQAMVAHRKNDVPEMQARATFIQADVPEMQTRATFSQAQKAYGAELWVSKHGLRLAVRGFVFSMCALRITVQSFGLQRMV